jgi:hypothetical protein
MKAYVATTGLVFFLILIAHVWRVVAEGAIVTRDPFFILTTLIAMGLCAWAWRVFWRL